MLGCQTFEQLLNIFSAATAHKVEKIVCCQKHTIDWMAGTSLNSRQAQFSGASAEQLLRAGTSCHIFEMIGQQTSCSGERTRPSLTDAAHGELKICQ